MAGYNTLSETFECPRCGQSGEHQVDLRFGLLDQIHYHLGDEYRWAPGKAPQNGGRPPEPKPVGSGYTECPSCGKDFFVRVHLEEDRLATLEPDLERLPYIPHKRMPSRLQCPNCEAQQEGEVLLFDGFEFGRFICGNCKRDGHVPLPEVYSLKGGGEISLGEPALPPPIQVVEVR